MRFYRRQNIFYLFIVLLVTACSPKIIPPAKPYVFDNRLELTGNFSKDEKNNLLTNLQNYWVDSLRPGKVRKWLFFIEHKWRPVFDTANVSRTISLMDGYLKSEGYYHATYSDTIKIDTVEKDKRLDKRVSVMIRITPNKPFTIDSFGYGMNDPNMQLLAENSKKETKIIPQKTLLAITPVSDELTRLEKLYRNNGYYFLTKNNLYAEPDTMNRQLLNISSNPFQQAQELAEANKRQGRSRVIVSIKQKFNADSIFYYEDFIPFTQYKVGKIYFYPEIKTAQIPDSVAKHPEEEFENLYTTQSKRVSIYSNDGLFIPRPLLDHLYILPGRIYNDSLFFKTLNNLNQIGAWQQVDTRAYIRNDSLIDLHFFLTPAIKQNIRYDFELSRNTGDILTTNNLYGIALNVAYRNRNVWKRAVQSVTNFRTGVEFNLAGDASGNGSVLQTLQFSLGQAYTFPRFVAPAFFTIRSRRLDQVRTTFSINGTYSDRWQYFRLSSLVGGVGYSWSKANKFWEYKPLNVELYSLTKQPLLDSAILLNPYLKNAFNTGTVLSQQLALSFAYRDKNIANATNLVRFAVEESGTLLGLIPGLHDKIYRYAKFEATFVKSFSFYNNTSLAMRAYGGIGFNYNQNGKYGNSLPFYKQFFGGGPNSMRAWGLRQLGLGSSLLSDTSGTFRDRYGDMQLEGNIEYRFPLFAVGNSFKVNSALFTDFGNVWSVRKDTTNPQGQFSFNRFGKDLAIAVGTGLRFDFQYFTIRLDFGLKLKDPARLENNGWLDVSHFTWRNNEFDIRNPPVTGTKVYRNNYGFQLGIGLPF
jgi:outer membrane protein assembly factor BamA